MPVKRSRGRPKGSKSRPKVPPGPEVTGEPLGVISLMGPTHSATLLSSPQQQQQFLQPSSSCCRQAYLVPSFPPPQPLPEAAYQVGVSSTLAMMDGLAQYLRSYGALTFLPPLNYHEAEGGGVEPSLFPPLSYTGVAAEVELGHGPEAQASQARGGEAVAAAMLLSQAGDRQQADASPPPSVSPSVPSFGAPGGQALPGAEAEAAAHLHAGAQPCSSSGQLGYPGPTSMTTNMSRLTRVGLGEGHANGQGGLSDDSLSSTHLLAKQAMSATLPLPMPPLQAQPLCL